MILKIKNRRAQKGTLRPSEERMENVFGAIIEFPKTSLTNFIAEPAACRKLGIIITR